MKEIRIRLMIFIQKLMKIVLNGPRETRKSISVENGKTEVC